MKLEVVPIPVSDLDRAKAFYGGLGWRLDADFSNGGVRLLQFTPPGSQCSIHFGTNAASSAPGSVQGLYLIVSDILAARDHLVGRGVKVSEVFHYAAGPAPFGGQVSGPAPDHGTYGSYATFRDPDGNGWLLQEVTTRFPGRVAGDTTYASAYDLSQALRCAEAAHIQHEKRTGQRDANWADWYAAYLEAEQGGTRPKPWPRSRRSGRGSWRQRPPRPPSPISHPAMSDRSSRSRQLRCHRPVYQLLRRNRYLYSPILDHHAYPKARVAGGSSSASSDSWFWAPSAFSVWSSGVSDLQTCRPNQLPSPSSPLRT
jgi:predicted enzyme related to lactoylglutathione lyase